MPVESSLLREEPRVLVVVSGESAGTESSFLDTLPPHVEVLWLSLEDPWRTQSTELRKFYSSRPFEELPVTWGHLYLALEPEVYELLLRVWTAASALVKSRFTTSLTLNVGRCLVFGYPDFDGEAEEVGMARSNGRCGFSALNGDHYPCQNSDGRAFWDTTALSFARKHADEMIAIVRQFFDLRLSLGLMDFIIEIERRWKPGVVPCSLALVDLDVDPRHSKLDAIVVLPEVPEMGRSELSCGHPKIHSKYESQYGLDESSVPARTLPGGVPIDDGVRGAMREAVANALDGEASFPPDPFQDGPSAIFSWLESPSRPWQLGYARYWDALWRSRVDLRKEFAQPYGVDGERFREWCRKRHILEGSNALISPPMSPAILVDADNESPEFDGGVNVVGYSNHLLGLGKVARDMLTTLEREEIGVSKLPFWFTPAPKVREDPEPYSLRYAVNLCVVPPQETGVLIGNTPASLWNDHFNIGYWFWETTGVPESFFSYSTYFDEVWAPTKWIESNLNGNLNCPIRYVPFPLELSDFAETADLQELESTEYSGPYTFLSITDFNSDFDRKNVLGIVRAYRDAFPKNQGTCRLILKVLNHGRNLTYFRLVQEAIAERSDIRIVADSLETRDVVKLMRGSDCYVSLHRCEGFGLPLAEAMACGLPVIATGYSGNLDFMTNTNSVLIGYDLTRAPTHGAYRNAGMWALPLHEQAVQSLRRAFEDQEFHSHLGQQGKSDVLRFAERSRNAFVRAVRLLETVQE